MINIFVVCPACILNKSDLQQKDAPHWYDQTDYLLLSIIKTYVVKINYAKRPRTPALKDRPEGLNYPEVCSNWASTRKASPAFHREQ